MRDNDHPEVLVADERDARRPETVRVKRRRAVDAVAGEIRATVRAQPALSLVLVLLALGLVPSLVWSALPRDAPERVARPDPRYASQSGSAQRTRATHIEARGDEDVDSAVETCGGIGLGHMASKYGLAPEPERVARRFAREYERAFRARVYEGCLHGLLYGG